MIDRKIIGDFAHLIGYIKIAISSDSYKDVKNDYEKVLNKLLLWINSYYKSKNFNIITHNESLEIHELLDEIKWKMITDKDIEEESLLSDNILIRYEIIIKEINSIAK